MKRVTLCLARAFLMLPSVSVFPRLIRADASTSTQYLTRLTSGDTLSLAAEPIQAT
ncbi:MAG: hypothetical protein HY962_14170 [Ignavibacteriae bacterium]|nr:hypothetical protein [Ignavibacteriota bacterium]